VTLHRNFAVLFPTTNIRRHVSKFHLLLQKLVHLSLDGIFLAVPNERGTEIERRHRIEVLVGSRVATHHSKFWIE